LNLYSEPILAPITPAGYAAISVIRLSGTGCIELVAKHVKHSAKLLKSPSHRLIHTTLYSEPGQDIDDVLLSVFRAPNSYTGEDCVEISCHGNPNIVNRIMECLLQHCRMAKPGEFTLRAYLNSKLDLSQAEAVNDLINAQASKAESAALMQLHGYLSQYLRQIGQRITEARLHCELAIDFADQDLPQIDLDALSESIDSILHDARELEAKGQQGKIIRDGIKVVLAGAPNAGKSSLFNALLQHNRAIVTPHPGTTRDYLEECISLSGFPVVIYDTAGLRDSDHEIESLGIAQSYVLMRQADIILYLIDSSKISGQTEESISEQSLLVQSTLPPELWNKTIIVFSKADLLPQPKQSNQAGIFCSVQEPDGLKVLSETILKRLMLSEELLHKPLITNARHLAALQKCIAGLIQAKHSLESCQGFEFTAFELATASSALEEILGVISTDDLLEKIFSNFCIGK